jgi:hypothetical protein
VSRACSPCFPRFILILISVYIFADGSDGSGHLWR